MKTLRKFGFVALFAAILFGLTGCPAPDNPNNSDHEHDWDNGVVTKKATLTEEGEKTLTCVICGETKTETIPKLWSDIENSTHITVGADASYKGLAINLDGEVPENAKHGRITITDVDGNFFEHDFDPTEKELRIPFVTAGEKYKASISWWTEDWALIGDNYNYVFDATDGVGFLKQTEKLTFTVKDGVLHCDKLPKYTVEPNGGYYVFNVAESNNKGVWNYLKWIGNWNIDSSFSVPDINIITELLNDKKTWSEKIIVLVSFNLNYEGKSYSVAIHDYNDDYFDVPGGWKKIDISDKNLIKTNTTATVSADKKITLNFSGDGFLDGYFSGEYEIKYESGAIVANMDWAFISADKISGDFTPDSKWAKDEPLVFEAGGTKENSIAQLIPISQFNIDCAINEKSNQLILWSTQGGAYLLTKKDDKSLTLPLYVPSKPEPGPEPEQPDTKPEQPAVSDTPGVPNEVINLVALGLVMDDAWAGSTVDADGTINYKSDYGACKLGGEPKFKKGDKIEIVFADAPAGVQIYWVDDPYEKETFDWGEGIASKNCHYSGPLNGNTIGFGEFANNVFTYTFPGDATFISGNL